MAVGGVMNLQEKQNIAENMLERSMDSIDHEEATENLKKLQVSQGRLNKLNQMIDKDYPEQSEMAQWFLIPWDWNVGGSEKQSSRRQRNQESWWSLISIFENL